MKNNNLTNTPDIKRNLFSLRKKTKNDINKLIPSKNNQNKSNNNFKLRKRNNSNEKNNYTKLNSFLSTTTPSQNIINQINIENNYITNIDLGKHNPLLSEGVGKKNNNINKNTNKNDNHTINISKNIEEIIKRRINQKDIENIKNKVKRINKNKKNKLLSTKTITMKEFEKTALNNSKNNNRKTIAIINNINEIKEKKINKKRNNMNNIKDLEDDKENKGYFETRRLSGDWGKDENKDLEKIYDKIISEEKYNNNTNKNLSNNISKLNIDLDENENKNNYSDAGKQIARLNSIKNDNYDYDSFLEEDNKSQNNINTNIINCINSYSNSKKNNNRNKNDDNNNFPIINISNVEDNKKNINEEVEEKKIHEIEINFRNEKDKDSSINQINNELGEKTLLEKRININDIQNNENKSNEEKDNLKLVKDKLELENIQKIISNTIKSININLKDQKFNVQETQKDSIFNSYNKELKINPNIYAPKKIISQFNLFNNKMNHYEKMTYSKKILSSQSKNINMSCQKYRMNSERMKYSNINDNNRLSTSLEGIKFIKINKLFLNDNNNQNNNYNDYYSLNNSSDIWNNDRNNIITNRLTDFKVKKHKKYIINNRYNKNIFKTLNNSFLDDNLNMKTNNNDLISNVKINNEGANCKEILNFINLEDLIILDNRLDDIKKSLLIKKQPINESFEYLNYFYNSSIYQNIDDILKIIIDSNYIKVSLNCKLISLIICYDCSRENNIFEQTHLLLKEIVELNYKSTILIYEYILENIISKNDVTNENDFWKLKLENIIKIFKNSEYNSEINKFLQFDEKKIETSFIEKIKTNSNYIINNINIILTNIKSKNNEYIQSLFKALNTISFKDIFDIFFTYIIYFKNIQGSILLQNIFLSNLLQGNSFNNNMILPYIKTKNIKKYSLVLDLEETLLHFNKNSKNNKEGFIDIRPGTLKFLDDISQFYELIVFNEGEKKFTDFLIDTLEENKIYFEHRFYREHIIIDNNDIVKDLVRIGRSLDKILIVDNMKQNFKLQKDNGILIKSFYGKEDYSGRADTILEELAKILIKIAQEGGDLRKSIIKYKNEIVNKITIGNDI